MKKKITKTGVFLTVMIVIAAFLVVRNSFSDKKTETFGSNPQPKTQTNQPYEISGTIKVKL